LGLPFSGETYGGRFALPLDEQPIKKKANIAIKQSKPTKTLCLNFITLPPSPPEKELTQKKKGTENRYTVTVQYPFHY
jgi:hypothetical protein